MPFIRNFFQKVGELLNTALLIGCVLGYIILVVKMLEPLSPVITLLFVLLGTFISFTNRRTATLCIVGLLLYGASWPAYAAWGAWPGMLICMIGILSWFTALFRPFPCLRDRTA